MKSVIIDLDGTISDDRHRRHLIAPRDWRAYHAKCSEDRYMNPGIIELCDSFGAQPVFITARPEAVRMLTETWLLQNVGLNRADYQLLMRPDGNTSPSRLVKQDILLCHSELDAVCAFDNRHDILEVYRDHGLQTVLVGYDWVPASTLSVPDLLRSGAKTFEERNAVYGETYEIFGRVMAQMFPDGLHLSDAASFNRLGVYVQIVTKVARYAASLGKGSSHVDSAHDAMVYSAMLEYLSRK